MGIKYDEFVKRPHEENEYTPEMIEELKKCSKSIWPFLEYVKVVHPDKGEIPFKPYDFQKQILKTISDNRFIITLCARQAGKCSTSDTAIKIRNKKTGEVSEIPIGEFFQKIKNKYMNRKFIEIVDTDEYEVLTPDGWKDFKGVGKTVPYDVYEISLDNGMKLKCADDHIVMNGNTEMPAKSLKPGNIISTSIGQASVKNITKLDAPPETMFDLIDVDGSVYYTNGISSHNSTVVSAYSLWYSVFHSDKFVGIVSNKQSSAIHILSVIRRMYEGLPSWIKPGVKEYSKTFVSFDNGTRIEVSATSADAFRGRPLNLLFCDEFAFVRKGIAEEFWSANYPTISASKKSKVIIVSTPHGMFNLFHRLYSKAERKENTFKHLKYTWRAVPGRDERWAEEERQNLGDVRFAQEQEVEFLGSINTVIETEVLENLFLQTADPPILELDGNLRVYEKPERGAVYVIGCLPPGQKVLTVEGIKNIEDINENDKLYDLHGEETNINNIQIYKNFEGDIYNIKLYGTSRNTGFTGEHPILASRNSKVKRDRSHTIYGNKRYREHNFNFIKVSDLQEGDWVRFPNIYSREIQVDDAYWKKYKSNVRKDFCMKSPLHEKDFWWFIGMWLGNGWIQNRGNSYSIHTSHNRRTEKQFALKIKEFFEKYGGKVSINDNEDENVMYTKFNSKHLFLFLTENFGRYSYGKFISEWVKYLPKEFKIELIKGYFDSDGYFGKKHGSITSISLDLLEGVQDILYSLGILSSINKLRDGGMSNIRDRSCKIKKTYQLRVTNYDISKLSRLLRNGHIYNVKRDRNQRYQRFSDDGKYIYFKVRKIDKVPYKGDVFNFETESHTFLCRNISTHNCDVSKGTGEHSSTIQVLKIIKLKPITLKQVAVFESNTTDVYSFAAIINRVSLYYNNSYIMVENNAEGSTVVSRLWWDYENGGLVNSGAKSKDLGIRASRSSKPKAVLYMKKVVEDGSLTLVDNDTVDQLSSFIEKNGKFFGKDMPDDLVSALYWACYLFTMRDILSESAEFKNEKQDEDDVWGIMTDIDEDLLEDWSWLDDITLTG